MAASAKPTYIQFRTQLPIGHGVHSSLEYWSEGKHGAVITAEVSGNWVILRYETVSDGKATKQTCRVPMTNVACIREVEA